MLVLTRKSGESIHIGEDVRVTVLSVQGQSVKVGIHAPRELAIHREEIYEKIVEENQLAASRASLQRAQMLTLFNAPPHGENGFQNMDLSEECVKTVGVREDESI